MILYLHSGYKAKDYKTIIPIPKVLKRAKMIKTIQKYESIYEHWGWKDPRTCLTISNWIVILKELELIKKLKIIFVSRSALSVARSLEKRNALPLKDGVRLWEIYTERAINFCESHNTLIYLSFEKILKKPFKAMQKTIQILVLSL